MKLADIPTEYGWMAGLLAGSGAVIGLLYRNVMAGKEAQIADLKAQIEQEREFKKTWQDISVEAVKATADAANEHRAARGKPPMKIIPEVVPEHHSPSTAVQRETAEIQTARAALAAAKRELGHAPRPTPERAIEGSDADILLPELSPVEAGKVQALELAKEHSEQTTAHSEMATAKIVEAIQDVKSAKEEKPDATG